eukprot:Phypoly_transcript_03740.p1 GENE.Phypoly_transcript_03740~~Phypoly_transcript_03740.p1  ORF type:complete len:758 (+),score=142.36 Phypoly_transcript_03740:89-2362(+)
MDADKVFRGLYITPHKVSLLILIWKYLCDDELSTEAKQDLALFIVNEIKVIDSCIEKSFEELKECLLELEDGDVIVSKLCEKLHELDVLDEVFDLFYTVQELLEDSLNEDGSLGAPALLERGSVLGIFVRKILYTFNELMFEPVSKLFGDLKKYKSGFATTQKPKEASFNSSVEMSIDEGEATVDAIANSLASELSVPFKSEMSPAEIEKFVALRGAKLEGAVGKIHRKEIQEEIDEIVQLFPNITRAHYLSFLNALYHKDLEGALESLHRYFDQDLNSNLNFPRATLCLAVVHFRFGHIEEGMTAIHETVRVAQERNDHECLAHVLSWLYIFAKEDASLQFNYDELLRRCVERAEQLNMHYLSSFGSIELTKHLLNNPPRHAATSSNSHSHAVWENLEKSQAKNVEKSMRSLAWKGHVTGAWAWEILGNWDMALYSCQLGISVEDFQRTDTFQIQVQEQGACWPHCKKAYLLYMAGDLRGAAQQLLDTNAQFPYLDSCDSPWQRTVAQILFEHFLNLNDFVRAEEFSRQLLAMSPDSGDCLVGVHRQALLDFRMGKFNDSIDKCHKLIAESTKRDHQQAHTISYLLLLAKCFLRSGNPDNALPHALGALAQCERYVLHSLWAEATILLAEIHLSIGNSHAAHELVDQSASRVMTNGSVAARANLYLAWAKCVLSEGSDIKRALTLLDEGLKFAKLLSIKHTMTEIYYLQAILWDKVGDKKQRNTAAHLMRETSSLVKTEANGVDPKEELRRLIEKK